MGSAVLCDCQKQWTSNMAARGHIASFIHEDSSPPWAEEEGNHFVTPAGDIVAHAVQPVLSIFSCQLWYVLPVLKFNSVYGGAIWLVPERMALYWGCMSEGSFSLPPHPTPIFFSSVFVFFFDHSNFLYSPSTKDFLKKTCASYMICCDYKSPRLLGSKDEGPGQYRQYTHKISK